MNADDARISIGGFRVDPPREISRSIKTTDHWYIRTKARLERALKRAIMAGADQSPAAVQERVVRICNHAVRLDWIKAPGFIPRNPE